MTDQGFFEGPERHQYLPALGRKVRAGHPDQLRASDVEVIRQRLLDHEVEDALERLAMVGEQHHIFMVYTYGEWALQMPATFAEHVSDQHSPTTVTAIEQWQNDISALQVHDHNRPVFELVESLLTPDNLQPDAAHRFRQSLAHGDSTLLDPIAEAVEGAYDHLVSLIHHDDLETAAEELDRYWDVARTPHDCFAQWVTTYPNVVLEEFGQPAAETMVRESFSSCSFHAGLFELADALTPEERTAWLADHLRAHFTGPDRQGSVLVVEDDDAYRLVMDPCGSGGAIRRRLADTQDHDLSTLPDATPMTFDRADEVPTYCTHCAFNEIHSNNTLDYPILLTEFDPDPHRPCTWLVPKS